MTIEKVQDSDVGRLLADHDRLNGDLARLGGLRSGHPVPVAPVGRAPAPPVERAPKPVEAAPEKHGPSWVAQGGLHRLGANVVTVVVGTIAGYISWLHLYALGMSQPLTPGLSHSQEKLAAGLTPFSIDGMIMLGTLKLRQARIEQRPAHWAAYAAVILGVALTMAGNIASAPPSIWAQVLAAAPPAAFLVSVEVLAGKPLTKNLWEMIRDLWQRRAARRAAHKADRAARAVAAKTRPAPPVAKPAQKPVEASAPRVGRSARVKPVSRASRTVSPASEPEKGTPESDDGPIRDLDGRLVGTKRIPAREVDGRPLIGEDLKEDARARVRARLAAGEDQRGLGSWVARQYDPPMSVRWGQELVAEVTQKTESATA
jgi:hypothetical protein